MLTFSREKEPGYPQRRVVQVFALTCGMRIELETWQTLGNAKAVDGALKVGEGYCIDVGLGDRGSH